MSMAQTTQHQSNATDLGQRYFVAGVFAVFFVEVAVTVANMGEWFEWSSLALGVVASLLVLCLGNALYRGSKTALSFSRFWVVLLLAVYFIAFVALQSQPDSTLPGLVGVNAPWQGYLKIAAYLLFAGLLFLPGPTLDFLSVKRGEALTSSSHTEMSDALSMGAPVELSADQATALDVLGSTIKTAAGALLAVGVFQLLLGLQGLVAPRTQDASQINGGNTFQWSNSALLAVEGLMIFALGGMLFGPGKAVRTLIEAKPRTTGLVMNVFNSLYGPAVITIFLLAITFRRLIELIRG